MFSELRSRALVLRALWSVSQCCLHGRDASNMVSSHTPPTIALGADCRVYYSPTFRKENVFCWFVLPGWRHPQHPLGEGMDVCSILE